MFWETNGDHNYSLKSDHDRSTEGVKRFLLMVEAVRGAGGRNGQIKGWKVQGQLP
jgi:hypothetical protein